MQQISLQKVLNYILISTIFMDAFVVSQRWFDMYVFYFIYAGYILYFMLRYRNIYFPKSIILFLSIIVLISIVTIYIFHLSYILLIKNILGITASVVAFYSLFRENDFDLIELFRTYFNIAFIVASIGIMQLIFYVIGLKIGYDYSSFLVKWRVDEAQIGILRLNSITGEPSHFAIIFTPAIYVVINSFLSKTKTFSIPIYQKVIILVAYLLTFSSLAYIAVVLSIFLVLLKQRYFVPKTKKIVISLLFIIPLFIIIILSILHIPEFKRRSIETIEVITKDREIEEVNLSTLTLYSKYVVARETFKKSPIFGTGLGTYEQDFARHAQKIIPQEIVLRKFGLNRKDAGSLLFRLITETGLFGVVIVMIFLFRNIVYSTCKGTTQLDRLMILNNSVIVFLILRFVRMGHYFVCGFFFFLLLFYYSHKQYKKVAS